MPGLKHLTGQGKVAHSEPIGIVNRSQSQRRFIDLFWARRINFFVNTYVDSIVIYNKDFDDSVSFLVAHRIDLASAVVSL